MREERDGSFASLGIWRVLLVKQTLGKTNDVLFNFLRGGNYARDFWFSMGTY